MALWRPEGSYDASGALIEELGSLPLVRVYNWVDAEAKGYDPLGYKPIPSADGSVGGRFDSTPASPFPFAYFGAGDSALATALWEVVFNKARPPTGGNRLLLSGVEVEQLAFRYVHNSHSCPQLILRDAPTCGYIGAPPEICWSDDYEVTREWAVYIRAKLPDIHGIRYLSRRTGASGTNIVTFGDRCRPDQAYEPVTREFRYVDPLGGKAIRLKAEQARIDII